ncbi:MAG: DUF2851 family protein [Bacteroidota bacterium]
MKESFVQFIWRYRRIEQSALSTTRGTSIQILQTGEFNTNAGPDFLHAKIQIGDTLWAGHVEIHIKASDWLKHQHQHDPAYQNVILHVVWEADKAIFRPDGQEIPCLELKPITTPQLFLKYKKLAYNQHKIPCQESLHRIADIKVQMWLDRLVIERLDQKTQYWGRMLRNQQNHWEEVFYQALAQSLGLPVNKDALEMLARRTPLLLLQKHRDNLVQVEALLFGQAGLLEELNFQEDYPRKLQEEYHFLKHKYNLESMPAVMWKFARMRPAHFPSIRIAQLALLIQQSHYLFSKVLALQSIEEAYHMFEVKTSYYWKDHFRLDQLSKKKSEKKLGRSTIQLMLINTIIPFIFLYGKTMDMMEYTERALQLLAQVPAEDNHLIRTWQERGIKAKSAGQSQGLIQLYKHYCQDKKCLDCAIGAAILKD